MSKITLNDLPSDKLPEFWKDNARINALYAPFRERSANARDWDAKLTFWKGIIETWCDYNKICTFTETELKKSFIQNGRTPACLSIVLSEMFKNGELQTLDQFTILPQKSWTGWAFDLAVKRPLSWGFSKIKSNFITQTNNLETIFVHLPSVKKHSQNFFNDIKSEDRNRLLSINELIELYNLNNVSIDTIKLWLHQLKCESKIDTIEYKSAESESSKSVLMVKFAPLNGKLETISNIDVAKCSLEENERNIMKKIEELETEKQKALENTKSFLKKGMKQMAKSWLRREHELGRRIEQQTKVLDNVGALIERLSAAETDGKTLAAYRSGLDALKYAFEQAGITEDSVDDTMADVQQVLDMHDDVQTTLSQPLNPSLDAELEQELEEILNVEDNTVPPPDGGKQDELPTPPKHVSEEDELMRRLNALKMPTESPTDKNKTPTMHNIL